MVHFATLNAPYVLARGLLEPLEQALEVVEFFAG